MPTRKPLLLFAPGAGAPSTSAWMTRWATRLSALGVVKPFDYPYMLAGRKSPDPLPRLIAAHEQALAAARAGHKGPVVLVGKSMGSRVGCHVAAKVDVAAVVCLGYPLRGANGAVRDEALVALRCPLLLVQGSRDPLCPLDLLETARSRIQAPHEVHIVQDGNHSLELPKGKLKSQGLTQDQIDDQVLGWIAAFVSKL